MSENSAPIVPEAPTRLWLPGLGVADRRVRGVARAVRDYDEALRLARHEVSGDWVVVIGDEGHPVYGFGRELPHPDDVEQILGARDVKRNGPRILAQSRAAAERERAQNEYRMSEMNGELAEHFESAFRHVGAHPSPRVYMHDPRRGRGGRIGSGGRS